MSFAAIRSGIFHQEWNSFGSNCSFVLLRFRPGLAHCKNVDARRCKLHTLATKVGGRSENSHSSKSCNTQFNLRDKTVRSSTYTNTNKSETHESKSIQGCDVQKNSGKKVFDRPATLLVFDIETTGFSRQTERIIEFALMDLIGGKNSTFQTLVNPGKDVPNAYIHGIRSDMVNRPDVPRFKELVPILLQYVRSRQRDSKPVVWIAHNGRRFDVPFIIREFQRCSVEIPEDWLFVDTLPLARQLVNPDGSKLASFSLQSLREHYRIPLSGRAHRAMQDVMTLSHVLQRITFDLKLTIPELMDQAFRASDLTKVSP